MKQQEIYNKVMDAVLPRLKRLAESAVYGDAENKFDNVDAAMADLERLAGSGVSFNPPYVVSTRQGETYEINRISGSLMAETDKGQIYVPDIINTPGELERLGREMRKISQADDKDGYIEHFMTTDELDSDCDGWRSWGNEGITENHVRISNEYGDFDAYLYFDKNIGDAWKVFNEDEIWVDSIPYTAASLDELSESLKTDLIK